MLFKLVKEIRMYNQKIDDLSTKAYCYYMDDDLTKADFFINEALKLDPDDFISLEIKYLILEYQNRWSEALIYCDKLLDRQPHSYEYLSSKGFIYCKLNDCENAVKAYDYALSLYIDEYELIRDKIKCLLKFNKKYEADEVASYITNKYSKDDGLMNNIGVTYSLMGDDVTAIKYFDKSLDLVLDSAAMDNKIQSLLELYGFDNHEIYANLMEIVKEINLKLNPPEPVSGSLICKRGLLKWDSPEEYYGHMGL